MSPRRGTPFLKEDGSVGYRTLPKEKGEPKPRGRPKKVKRGRGRPLGAKGHVKPFESQVFSKVSMESVLNAIKESAEQGNSQSQKLFTELAGLMVKREDAKVELTADDYRRILREARLKLEEFEADTGTTGDLLGNTSLRDESQVLPDEVCLDTEQEHRGDNQVATLAIPS